MNEQPATASEHAAKAHERATLREIAKDPKAIWHLARDAVSAWIDDFAPSMGAAISYYTVFSIAPLMLIVIAVAGLVLGQDAASGRIFEELRGFLGEEGAAAIQGMVKSASGTGKGTFGTIIGIVTLLIGATTVFGELQSALDRIWRTPAAAKNEGIWKLLRERILSFGLILAIGFLLLVSLVVSAGISAFGTVWNPMFGGGWQIALQVLNFIVGAAIIAVLFALIYKYLPRARIGWHDVWIGAAVTALLFSAGKLLIGLYIGKSGVTSGFGAAGSLVVILLWVYYSSQIFLLGAEFTWIYAYHYGSRRGEGVAPQPVGKIAAAASVGVTATAPAAAKPKALAHAQPNVAAKRKTGAGKRWSKAGAAAGAAFLGGALLDVAARRFGAFDWMRARWHRLVH